MKYLTVKLFVSYAIVKLIITEAELNRERQGIYTAWIESHTVLRNHRKILLLSRELRLSVVQTIGHLHLLWHAALEQQEDGDLSKWSNELIAELACFTGNADLFVKSLQAQDWLGYRGTNQGTNGALIQGTEKFLHDWWDYAGRYLQGKYGKTPMKWQTIKKLHTNHQQTTSRLETIPTNLPDQPNQQTKGEPAPEPGPDIEIMFEAAWNLYPNKDGKKEAFKQFKASVATAADYVSLLKAMGNYLNSDKAKRGFIKDGKTFFNNWQDWINPTPSQMQSGKSGKDGDNTAGAVSTDKYDEAGLKP